MTYKKTIQSVAILILNIVFQPLLFPIYCIVYVLFVDNFYCIGCPIKHKNNLLLVSTINLVFFPCLALLLLKALGFIKRLGLQEKKDKIVVSFALSIFYFWTFYLFKNNAFIPPILLKLQLGFFVLVSLMPFFLYYQNINIAVSCCLCLLYNVVLTWAELNKNDYFSIPFMVCIICLSSFVASFVLYKKQHTMVQLQYSHRLALLSTLITLAVSYFIF